LSFGLEAPEYEQGHDEQQKQDNERDVRVIKHITSVFQKPA
jgi:hypothetical protein